MTQAAYACAEGKVGYPGKAVCAVEAAGQLRMLRARKWTEGADSGGTRGPQERKADGVRLVGKEGLQVKEKLCFVEDF